MRHWFHQYPELTWQEANTAKRIRQCLKEWQIDWRACANHGTLATLASKAKGSHLALRADMDALPIHEKSPVEFCSTEPGKMHACGHDGHMAALLGTALWLKQHESELPGPVTLVFQPAEEGGHGAKAMIEDGALTSVDRIYGWHNWPALSFGTAVCPDGAVMSGNGTFAIEVVGKGGHASQPEATCDPVLASAAITLNLQQIVSRKLPPQAAAVVSVTSISSEGGNPTIIPEIVKLEGGIRISDPKWRPQINELITQIAQDTAKSYGVEAQVSIYPRYEATINDASAAQAYREVLAAELGDQFNKTDLMVPIMASEDFSYYLQQIPGAFALIGMAEQQSDGKKYEYPCHNPNYEFNDRLIETVMKVFVRLVGLKLPVE